MLVGGSEGGSVDAGLGVDVGVLAGDGVGGIAGSVHSDRPVSVIA